MTDPTLDTILKGLQRRLHPGGREWPSRPARAVAYGIDNCRLPLVPHVTCKSGFTFSMQASEFHYCEPRDNHGPWTHVELGCLSKPVPALMPHAENESQPLRTVYPYVPLELVAQLVLEEGGFA